MGKQTRRQRKHLRVKREHAEVLGVPVAPASVGRPRARDRRAGSKIEPSEKSHANAGAGKLSRSAPEGHGWSTWPLSLKLILGGIAILVVIGLYRRYTEDAGRDIQVDQPAAASASSISQGRDQRAPTGSIRTASDMLSTPADPHGR